MATHLRYPEIDMVTLAYEGRVSGTGVRLIMLGSKVMTGFSSSPESERKRKGQSLSPLRITGTLAW